MNMRQNSMKYVYLTNDGLLGGLLSRTLSSDEKLNIFEAGWDIPIEDSI